MLGRYPNILSPTVGNREVDMTTDAHHRHYLPGMGHDRLIGLYDPLTRLIGVAALHGELIDQAGIQPGHRVLEIGCGTGNLALQIAQRHPTAEVIGLDPDPRALARARRKAARRGRAVQLDQGFAEELPYGDHVFDRVVSSLMFHHLGPDEKGAALREVRRVLRPGGTLHLLDLGGAKVASDGVMARRSHRNPMLQDNLGDRIPQQMRAAGLADAVEVAHRVRRVMGRITFYRATAPEPTGPGAGVS